MQAYCLACRACGRFSNPAPAAQVGQPPHRRRVPGELCGDAAERVAHPALCGGAAALRAAPGAHQLRGILLRCRPCTIKCLCGQTRTSPSTRAMCLIAAQQYAARVMQCVAAQAHAPPCLRCGPWLTWRGGWRQCGARARRRWRLRQPQGEAQLQHGAPGHGAGHAAAQPGGAAGAALQRLLRSRRRRAVRGRLPAAPARAARGEPALPRRPRRACRAGAAARGARPPAAQQRPAAAGGAADGERRARRCCAARAWECTRRCGQLYAECAVSIFECSGRQRGDLQARWRGRGLEPGLCARSWRSSRSRARRRRARGAWASTASRRSGPR